MIASPSQGGNLKMICEIPTTMDWDFVMAGPCPGWPDLESGSELHFHAAKGPPTHVEPIALVAVAAWVAALHPEVRIVVDPALQTPYLWKTGLLRALSRRVPWSDEVSPSTDFYPLSRVSNPSRVEAIGGGVTLALHLDEGPARRAVGSAVSEIVRNAEEHARSEQPAFFAAGYFRSQRRLTFAVADTGVGFLRHLRRKGVATLIDDDASAIEKAVMPFVTGEGPRGTPGAPSNAGLGLHTTRLFALESGGEMRILSGNGLWSHLPGRQASTGTLDASWTGALVSVTLKPDQIGAFPLSIARVGGSEGAVLARWSDPPPGAMTFEPPIDGARFAADKAWYGAERARLHAALSAAQSAHVDFRNASYTTQSALHALLFQPIHDLGERALDLLTFSGGGETVRAVTHLVVGYAVQMRATAIREGRFVPFSADPDSSDGSNAQDQS